MSTIEKLFVQIFERKRWIIDQAKHQTHLFDQHLASKLLIDEIAPPPWLWTPPLHSHTSDPNEFNKEELISGVLLPRPQPVIPYSSSHCSLYNKPVFAPDNEELRNGMCMQVNASDKGPDAGDRPSSLPQCSVSDAGCAFDCVHELDHTAVSPLDRWEKGIQDIYHDPAPSLARVQRSKSRQRAIELRNSGKAAKSCSRDENIVDTYAGGISGSAISSLQNDHVGESVFVNPVDTTTGSCAMGEVKVGDCRSKVNGNDIFSVRMTRSRSSSQQLSSLNVGNSSYISGKDGGIIADSIARSNEQSNHDKELLELVGISRTMNESSEGKKAKSGDDQSKDMGSNVYLGRITRSRNSSQLPNCMNKSTNPDSSCDNDKVEGLSNPKDRCNSVDKSVELIKPSPITDDSCGLKEEVMDCHSKEQESNADFGRIKRSRSSCQSFNNVNGSTQAESVGKSTQPPQSPSWFGGVAAFQNVQGPQMNEARSLPSQGDQYLCGENAREHSSKGNSEVGHVARNLESEDINSIRIISKAVYSSISDQRVIRSRFSASSKSNKVQGSQMSVGRSLPSQKDQEPCTINSAYYSDKENVADEYPGTNIRGETTSIIGEISKPLNSSQALGCRVTRSRSNASNKPPLAQSLKRSEGIDVKEVSGSKIEVLPCISNSDTVDVGRCAANVAESEVDSDELVDARSGCPGPNLDVASLRVGSEAFVLRPPSDCNIFVKPKQLNFDAVEESILNGISCPTSEKEIQGRSSETFADLVDVTDKTASVSYQAKCSSSPEKPLLNEQEDLCKEKEPRRFSSEAHVETYEASRSSNGNAASPIKQTSEVPNEEVTHMLLESNNYKEQCSSVDHLSISQVAFEDLIGRLPKIMGSNLSNASADTGTDLSLKKVVVKHDDGQSTKLVSEDSKLDGDFSGDPGQSTDADYAIISKSGVFKNPDSTVELPFALLADEKKGNFVQQIIDSGISQCQNADSLWRHMHEEKPVVCSKSTEDEIAKNAMPRGSFSFGLEDSWPQHKRRKIEGQLTDVLSASPSLREEGVKLINRDSITESLNGAEDNPNAVLEAQHFSLSDEEDVAQLDISEGLLEDMHQNEEGHMIEGSESSPRMQVEEVELSLEGRGGSANMPFTFMDDGLRVSFISSLINQAAGDSQGCFTEEVGVTDPNSEIVDAGIQCFVEENQVPTQLEDKLGLAITEHFCGERTLQKKRSNLEGNDKFLCCSVGSPHSHSLDLTQADGAMPVFEGFIMQTDDKQPCIAGEGISFDKFDLSDTAIERASILEQLCRSACMNSPLSCSSTTYHSHTIPSLYQSVPNGLLEGMNLRSTFSMNDTGKQLSSSCLSEEVDCFHERSYSDCIPKSSCQSARNTRNPYSSPVGKFWDRITSNSGSSEKRASLNPELPCINEENENADEVAETFPEGVCSEMATRSVKREPLADITENPNPPASVSEVEIYADRCSLDSVKTEFSFTGTHTRVKQKLGDQHGRGERYANKAKENQNVSVGANGVKRATESFHNRFSKPKLPGKTSMRKGGPSYSEKESKPNNIVSNITSFIPLVQQKQAASVVTGKRDIKVKALEAADAAKRLAEKKEVERKMKKEALKLERARLEKENLRQLELQKKRKKEEHKKKEADMAAKKRQREEEDRKEKERKRKRVEESHRQRQEHDEKLRGEKELKFQTKDTRARANERKEYKDETDKHKKMEKFRESDNLGKVSETEPRPTRIPSSDARKVSSLLGVSESLDDGGNNPKVTRNLDKVIENDVLIANANQEQSYDISPYKGSDDEDEEEDDDVPNSKAIPSWASKHCVAQVVSSQQTVNPEAIFPLESFCNIAEVLLPRKHQSK
ncbi:uncharacterized protein LOC132173702 [Corylus avellana]|uniref:uncharacterized protein LOC132173702 n=1 Tax=Corylus avellana TaxID=13451 RepID=UPI00286CC892|nr:uncharacterized protein LOC132173702 [Corylus avellana]